MSQWKAEVISMKKTAGCRTVRAAAVLCFLGALASQAVAAQFQARWEELGSILSGYDLSIPLPGGATVGGELLSVRPDCLVVDISRVSRGADYRKGPASIPRTSVTTIRASKSRGSWGKHMGVIVGQVAGILAGGEFVTHVAKSEAAGVPSFFAIDVGATVAGYYLGKSRDRHALEISIEPNPEAAVSRPAAAEPGGPAPAPRP
jgi:hypothetical protein